MDLEFVQLLANPFYLHGKLLDYRVGKRRLLRRQGFCKLSLIFTILEKTRIYSLYTISILSQHSRLRLRQNFYNESKI